MNRILIELKKNMKECLEKYVQDILPDDLEDRGAIFYMNGKNGTEFDWYVNDKVSDFMIFYNDEDNLGAVKATIYNNGELLIYVYGEQGKNVVQRVQTNLDVTTDEVLELAIIFKNKADELKIWDENIENIETDTHPDNDQINDFLSHAHYYDDMKARRQMLGQAAYVSKKIIDEGCKIGYMCRDEAVREHDSGWAFMAGDEDEEYVENSKNIQLMSIHQVVQIDNLVWKYINSPVGTRLVRVSDDEFEPDEYDNA